VFIVRDYLEVFVPLYSYECDRHGVFDLVRPMSRSAEDAPCPDCGLASGRLITPPQIFSMSANRRQAAECNERSRHEPAVATPGCAHDHRAPSHSATAAARSAAEKTRNGKPPLQVYKGPRPWVVEHR
jgi:putative FmdB family regulatory protein